MITRKSLHWPITLGVVMIVLLVALTVGWIVVTIIAALRLPNPGVYWAALAVGATFLVLVLVGVVLYLLLTIKSVRVNQRQSNFIDSVTHELKSPLASLKLYLQTLSRHQVTPAQQAEFHRAMLEDLERLDSLIDHLLEAARMERPFEESERQNVDLVSLLQRCCETAQRRYRLPSDAIELNAQPATVRARPADLEILFRNLVDNAIKYGGDVPAVLVDSRLERGRVVTRITDNGRGIPAKLRRKIFGRFVRLGDELERQQTGTGLGLFLVRTLVRNLKGKITVRSRSGQPGTVFEVDLPAEQSTVESGEA